MPVLIHTTLINLNLSQPLTLFYLPCSGNYCLFSRIIVSFSPLILHSWYKSDIFRVLYRNLSDSTREFWRNYRYFKHQDLHSSRQTARVSETSKISKNSAQAISIGSRMVRKRIFFETHDSPERFSVKKVRTFVFFSPLWKWRFSVFLSKSWSPQIIAPFTQ